ncbi:MAG: hypothetical protein K0Q73_4858, partial [Paenibacillus sp.]|nr:hypothetical protein [Paenibacillus sp.]
LKELLHIMCRWGDRHVERVYGDKVKILENTPGLNET